MSKPTTIEELDAVVNAVIAGGVALIGAELLAHASPRRTYRDKHDTLCTCDRCNAPEQHQPKHINGGGSFVDAIQKSYSPVFRALPDDEFNRLTSLIDSLKLERALKRHSELVAIASDKMTWLEELELRDLRTGVESMIRRGVKVL